VDHLRRDLAPLSEQAWQQIEQEATRTLRHFLVARALVDFNGPKGWEHSAETVGQSEAVEAAAVGAESADGVRTALRVVQPLTELRTSFQLSLAEMDNIDRGAVNPDLDAVTGAARRAALAEDSAVFHGHAAAGIQGIAPASPHDAIPISDDYDQYPGAVARAVATLRTAGVSGPYAVALGPRCYTGVIETTEHGGYPVLEHIKLIAGGPVIWAPGVNGAVVLSTRGGDYEFVSGQDFAIGYAGHSRHAVELYIEESFTLLIHEPKGAVPLRYPDNPGGRTARKRKTA
jgi:uncharacterized linocin/CFP29 family protein